jgi:hypothetical protein
MGEDLRPDRCGVIFEFFPNEKTVIATANYFPDNKNVKLLIEQMITDGYIVWIVTQEGKNLLLPFGITESEASDFAYKIFRRSQWRHLLIKKT